MSKIISKAYSWTPAQREEFIQTTIKNLSPYLVVLLPVFIEQIPAAWSYSGITIFLLQRALSFFRLYVKEVKK